ncbi:CapA family protein [Paenibacillus tarimensis]
MLSRSDTHQNNKQKRRRRLKRLLILNITMLLLISGVSGLLWANHKGWINLASDNRSNGTDGSPDSGGSKTPGAGSNEANSEGEKESVPEEGLVGEDENSPDPAGQDNATVPEGDASEDDRTVLLAFVGDILLAGSVQDLMKRHGFDYPYAKALSYLSDADLTAGNLENPITERGTPAENKQYVFKGAPNLLPSLKEAGFDIVSLANNHTLDQGVEGLFDTMRHLDEAGIAHTGAGKDDTEAFTPTVLEANGIKVAYFGLSRVVPLNEWKADRNYPGVAETYNTTRAVNAIRKAEEEADVTVVLVHWGKELADDPEEYQRAFAREYIDAGADLVIGAHPHVLQGFEQYKGKWIAYSLGNFIFNITTYELSTETGVLDAKCMKTGDCSLRLHPMKVDSLRPSQPAPLEGDEAVRLLNRVSELSFNVLIDKEGNIVPRE